MLDFIVSTIGAVVMAIIGYLVNRNAKLADEATTAVVKDILALEKQLKELDVRLHQAITRAEARELINDMVKPIHVLLKEIKEDVRNLNSK